MKKFLPSLLATAMLLAGSAADAGARDIIDLHGSDLLNRGVRALKSGDMERAITSLERYIKNGRGRNVAVAHNNLCIAYQYVGDLDAAVENCTTAIKLNPKYWRAYNNRGNVHFVAGALTEAFADYEAALRINPKSRAARENLEMVRLEVSKASQ